MKGIRVFRSNKSQSILMPEVLPESVKQVDTAPIGRYSLNLSAGDSWGSWFSSEGVTADFTPCRDQPKDEKREDLVGHTLPPELRAVNSAE